MNLGEVLDIFNLVIADKAPDSEDMTPERFTTLLKYANKKHFTAAVDKKKWNSLRPFTVVLGADGTMSLKIEKDGTAALPDDYVEHKSSRHQYLKNGQVKHSVVRKIDDQKWDHVHQSAIEKPTRRHPYLNVKDDYIRVAPADLRYIIFTYIRKPVDPVFVADYETYGFPVYDEDNSTELEWDDENVLDIIFIMLREFGVIATIEDVQAAAASKAQKK